MSNALKGLLWLIIAVAVLAGGYALYTQLRPTGAEPAAPIAGAPAGITDKLARGEYLARAADCVACHTAPGGAPYAGGFAFKLPFGTIYGTNITADKETGIGNWSDDQFVRAVREGIGPQGNLYPAMPYTSYTGLSRDDVLAIKDYLFSLPPVKQANPQNDLSFPFNQRWGMKFWNLAFFNEQRFTPDLNKDEQWNRGAYLATALGHCGECHTPRNLGFGLNQSKHLSGEVVQGWFAANITPDKQTGIGGWSDQQLSQYLATGHAPGRSSAAGPMAEAVENSLQFLTPEDNLALVKYLRDIEPIAGDGAAAVNLQPKGAGASTPILPGGQDSSLGRRVFANDCSGCHQWNGPGRQSEYASLVGSTAVNDPQGRSVVQAILKGTSISVGERHEMMPAFGSAYSDEEVAAVANFVVGHFGDKQGKVTAKQVAEQRKQ
ncbi:TPA: c-type cytochrome [Serratia marcescens]|uniref:c-type cytochrome n=1 Tax=Serratia TaxID=613 RepID=UPI001037D6B4|nr:c-type cytochrome [Serratia marcescens]TBU69398.1 c-type cytochrome [Serratia marcescens]HAV2279073.1 c-type cytochrome [Serratia marcescens]